MVFFSFSRVDHESQVRTWLLFRRGQVQQKSNWPTKLFGWINNSGRIVNKSRPGPNYLNFSSKNFVQLINSVPDSLPNSRKPCRNASTRAALAVREVAPRYAIRGMFVGCCASAITPPASSPAMDRVDKRAAFFIAHFALAVFITNSEAEKRVIYGRRETGFVEAKSPKSDVRLNCKTLQTNLAGF
jgi:hypothetical protein